MSLPSPAARPQQRLKIIGSGIRTPQAIQLRGWKPADPRRGGGDPAFLGGMRRKPCLQRAGISTPSFGETLEHFWNLARINPGPHEALDGAESASC